jgi:hypothetical protein
MASQPATPESAPTTKPGRLYEKLSPKARERVLEEFRRIQSEDRKPKQKRKAPAPKT